MEFAYDFLISIDVRAALRLLAAVLLVAALLATRGGD